MNPARPDDQEDQIDMDDGTQAADDSDQGSGKVQTMTSDDTQRLASNPNIINK